MLKLEEIQHYPIGENGLKLYQISRGCYTGSPDIKEVINWKANDILQPVTKMRYKVRSVKPILFPLSSLVKEIEVGGKRFVPYIELLRECNFDVDNMSKEDVEYYKPRFEGRFPEDPNSMMFCEVLKMFEWKIDVFNLIGQGKAVSVMDLDVNPYR